MELKIDLQWLSAFGSFRRKFISALKFVGDGTRNLHFQLQAYCGRRRVVVLNSFCRSWYRMSIIENCFPKHRIDTPKPQHKRPALSIQDRPKSLPHLPLLLTVWHIYTRFPRPNHHETLVSFYIVHVPCPGFPYTCSEQRSTLLRQFLECCGL